MSELDELRALIAEQHGQPDEPLPLHGEPVVRFPAQPGDADAVRVTVEGVAHNTADGAIVIDDGGSATKTDLALWPDDVVGERVSVTGIVTPATVGEGVLEDAYWQPAP